MAQQTLLYSLTINGKKTYILASLDNPVIGINLLRPNNWEQYVSDVFRLTNPNEVVTLFNIQNSYHQYDRETGLTSPTGLNSYNLSSSDTASIILREAIAHRADNNQYAFNYIMSRTSYRSLMAHNIISKIFLLMSINSSFLNAISFRAWDRFAKTCSLGLSLLKEKPMIKSIKFGVDLARKLITPRIFQITFFSKIHAGIASFTPFLMVDRLFNRNQAAPRRAFENSLFSANFPLVSAFMKFIIACSLYEYAFAPFVNYVLTSALVPTAIQIAAPALIVSFLNITTALVASYYAASFIMRLLSASHMLLPGTAAPVDEHLAIDASLINRHYSSWTNWFFVPESKEIYQRLSHLELHVARPSFMSSIFNNQISRVISDFIYRRLLGYSNTYQPADAVAQLQVGEEQDRPRLVVLPVNLLYGEQGFLKSIESIPGNDLKPCLIWSVAAAEENNPPRKTIMEFNNVEMMNEHLRRNAI